MRAGLWLTLSEPMVQLRGKIQREKWEKTAPWGVPGQGSNSRKGISMRLLRSQEKRGLPGGEGLYPGPQGHGEIRRTKIGKMLPYLAVRMSREESFS